MRQDALEWRRQCSGLLLWAAGVCLVPAASLAGAGGQGVGEQEFVTTLDTTTVYATRSPRASFSVPAIVSEVDTDSPGNVLAADVADLLEFTPGVEVEGSPRRNGQIISIRGFDDESVITLVDDRRQNFESVHDGRFFVDPTLLKSVELVKGASSASYGGGAIGGVVAFETKDAADFLAPGQTRGAALTLGYRSGNREYAPGIIGFGRLGALDLVTSLAYRDSGNIRQGDDHRPHTPDKLYVQDNLLSGFLKVSQTFRDVHTFRFQAQILNNDGREPNSGFAVVDPISNPLVDKEVQDNQFSLKYAFAEPGNDRVNLKLHAYYNDTEVEEIDISGSNNGRVQTRQLSTVGFTIDNQSRFASRTLSHTLSHGFEIYTDEQSGIRTDPATGRAGIRPGVPNAEATHYGFYLQDEIAAATPMGSVLLVPAVRYDHYSNASNEPLPGQTERGRQSESEFSPKISLSYQPAESFLLFASWARAFRAPNLTELYPAGQHFPGNRPFIGPDGQVVMEPVTRPVLGPDMRPVIGPDGRPVVEPVTRPVVGPGGRPVIGPGGRPVMEPVTRPVIIPDNQFIANPELMPETVTTIEIGAGVDVAGLFTARDRMQIKGAWFSSSGDDFIDQEIDQLGGTTQFLNIPRARLHGWELFAQYQLHPLFLKLGLSEVRAKNRDTGEYLSNNVPLTVVTDVAIRIASMNSIFGWRGRFADDNDRVSAGITRPGVMTFGAEATPGYSVHDLYYRWSTDTGSLAALTIDVGVENLFDRVYTKRFATLVEEGRSYALKVSYQW